MRVVDKSVIALCATLLVSLTAWPVYATNISFMPGDAFFHAEIDLKDLVETFAQAGRFELSYVPPKTAVGNLGGYIGMQYLEVDNVSRPSEEKLADALQRAGIVSYGLDRRQPISVMVYNRDFDLSRNRIFMKYNENWRGPVGLSPIQDQFRMSIQYEPFLKTYEAVVHDWGRSEVVPGLAVEVDEAVAGELRDKPKKIAGKISTDKTTILLIDSPNTKAIFDKPSSAKMVILRGQEVSPGKSLR